MKKIVIKKDGTIIFVYNERIINLFSKIPNDRFDKRASYVEPDPDKPGEWVVDLTLSEGPKINGFKKRSDAITFELKWLDENILVGGQNVRS